MSQQPNTEHAQTTINNSSFDSIPDWANAFYQARKVERVSPHTLTFYKQQLGHFLRFCDGQVISQMGELTPDVIRRFLLAHEESGHNPGGIHAVYRVVKTFLRWYEAEAEPPNWKNPIKKVKAPKLPQELLLPVSMEHVDALLATCDKSFMGLRDAAIIITLLDTGVRAGELASIKVSDINLITGEVRIQLGKGSKGRIVFLGKNARKIVRRYMRVHPGGNALFVAADGERLEYLGLRGVMLRRAKAAGITPPSLHSFRRAFALNCLRSGMDIYTLQRLMGHASLDILRRYLAQTTADLQDAHDKFSPADQLKQPK
jgi:site-specific recombinase XerD